MTGSGVDAGFVHLGQCQELGGKIIMVERMYRSKIVRRRIYPEGSPEYLAQLRKPPKKKKKLREVAQKAKQPKRDEYFRPRTHKEFLDFLDEEDAKARRGFKKK